jgi:hypothetical protein
MYRRIVVLIMGLLVLSACVRQPVDNAVPDLAPAVRLLPAVAETTTALPVSSTPLTLTDAELTLTILSPVDGAVVAGSPVEVVILSNVETVLTIDGELFILPPGKQCAFLVSLVEGYNSIELVASDYAGDEVEKILTVIYEQ